MMLFIFIDNEELYKILERENRLKLYQECLKFKTRVDLGLALFKDDIWSH